MGRRSRLWEERWRLLLICCGALAVLLVLAILDGGRDGPAAEGDGRWGEWRALPAAKGARQAGMTNLGAVRAGHRVVVVGGASYRARRVSTLEYDLRQRRWHGVAESTLRWRAGYSLVRAGREVVVWGGTSNTGALADGARYRSRDRTWHRMAPAPLRKRAFHSAVWTGERMLVWGGADHRGRPLGDGASYDPSRDRWRSISRSPLRPRRRPVAVWTGERMLVWGGSVADRPGRRSILAADGASYDPATDSWSPIRRAPVRWMPEAQAFWTGEAMLVWSGGKVLAYFPLGDYWAVLPRPPLRLRMGTTAAWDGDELILWGGTTGPCGACYRGRPPATGSDGAAYDPRSGRWRLLPTSPLSSRDRHVAVPIEGGGLLVWGGCCSRSRQLADGAVYVSGKPPPAARLGAEVVTACRKVSEENDVEVRCPGWLPGSRSYDGSAAYTVEHDDFDGDRCSQLTELINVRHGAGGAHPFHVWFGARCRRFPLHGEDGRWPPSPNVHDYLAFVAEAVELPGRPRDSQLVRPRIVGSARVHGERAMVLAVDPFPGGGLHGGHYAIVWNAGSSGYALSLHYNRGDESLEPTGAQVRALARAAESMRPVG